jgi:hypothetical protein
VLVLSSRILSENFLSNSSERDRLTQARLSLVQRLRILIRDI